MKTKTTWVVRTIEIYEDEEIESLEYSYSVLATKVDENNILARKRIDIPFPIETGHPRYEGHLFEITAPSLVDLLKSKSTGGFQVYNA